MAGRGSSKSYKSQNSQTEAIPGVGSSKPDSVLTTVLQVKEPETTENITSQAAVPQSNDLTQGQGSRAAGHEGPNVSGTENALNATGPGSQIEGKDTIVNSGYGAGNTELKSDGEKNHLGGCSGTQNALNAGNGGKISFSGTTLNLGAFSGAGGGEVKPPVKDPETTENIASEAVVPQSNDITQGQGSRAASHEGPNVSGTENALNATGHGSQIEGKDTTANSGYGAGNTKHRTDGKKNHPGGCSGTKDAVNAEKENIVIINISSTTLNLGAFSGGGSSTPPAVLREAVLQVMKINLNPTKKENSTTRTGIELLCEDLQRPTREKAIF